MQFIIRRREEERMTAVKCVCGSGIILIVGCNVLNVDCAPRIQVDLSMPMKFLSMKQDVAQFMRGTS